MDANQVNWLVQNATFGLAPEFDLGPLDGHYDDYQSGKPIGDATTWAMEKMAMAAGGRKMIKDQFEKKLGAEAGKEAAEKATKEVADASKKAADDVAEGLSSITKKITRFGNAGKEIPQWRLDRLR